VVDQTKVKKRGGTRRWGWASFQGGLHTPKTLLAAKKGLGPVEAVKRERNGSKKNNLISTALPIVSKKINTTKAPQKREKKGSGRNMEREK